ncbi:MAG: RNA polymerase sigma factor for flagellar operon FliA [Bacillota bacterium]|nr:MAG: RNA polymerase sigma factor for flagellar operon FliA [Bacillota bacterium]MBS3951249.1 FliA/WhiG family RNA polymerase sigma factor [Peptococcaceae bacterium]
MHEGYKDKLIMSYLPLVKRIAARLYIPSPEIMDKEDLVSQGLLGLMDAVNKFDPSREVSFESYASRRIKGAMLDSIRALSFSPRSVNDRIKNYRAVEERLLVAGEEISELRISQELGLSIDQVRDVINHIALRSVVSLDRMLFSDDGEEVAVSAVIGSDNSPNPETILVEIELRSRLAQALLKLPQRDREMLSLYYVDELTLKEIAAVFGVTEGRVSQLHSRAILRLRGILGKEA